MNTEKLRNDLVEACSSFVVAVGNTTPVEIVNNFEQWCYDLASIIGPIADKLGLLDD